MKRLIVALSAMYSILSVRAVDITSLVRDSRAMTVTRIQGRAYDASGNFDVAALFDGSQGAGATHRWIENLKPSESSPIVIQYVIDGDFRPSGRPSEIVVAAFTLYNTWCAADSKTRAPSVLG